MGRKLALLGIWVAFVFYTLWLAPLDQPDTYSLVGKLLTFQWGKVNAILPTIFSLMGVWPMIYGCLIAADSRGQPFRGWPYFLGSNFTGVLCLLPYLILRQRNPSFTGNPDPVLRVLEHRTTAIFLLLGTMALLGYAALLGDWADYWHQFQTRPFVHLISLDFLLMGVIFPITPLFDDDMARRGLHDRRLFWAVALVPLLGPLGYLCLRPSLVTPTQRPFKLSGSGVGQS